MLIIINLFLHRCKYSLQAIICTFELTIFRDSVISICIFLFTKSCLIEAFITSRLKAFLQFVYNFHTTLWLETVCVISVTVM